MKLVVPKKRVRVPQNLGFHILEERLKRKEVKWAAAIGKVVEKVEVKPKEVEKNRTNILKHNA
jgi:hypothetical protein